MNLNKLSLIVLLCFGMTLLHAQSLDDIGLKALAAKSDGDYKKAIKLFEKMVELRPDSVNLQTQLGDCYCYSSQLEDALDYYSRAISLDPANYYVYMARGTCYDTYRYYDKAVIDYSEGIELAQGDSLALKSLYLNRGSTKNSYRDMNGSLEDNLLALSYDTTDIGVHNNIGMTYAELGEPDKCEYHLKTALALDSNFFGAWMNLGFFYSEQKEFEEALTYLDYAVEHFPEQGYGWNNRGMVKHELGDSQAALKDIQKSLKLLPHNSYAFRNLAIIDKDMGNLEKACQNCQQAISLGFTTNYGPEMKDFYSNNCSR